VPITVHHKLLLTAMPLLQPAVPAAGMYSDSFQAHLQHLADIVLCVQSLADNSDIYRLLPEPTR
jgi:hypothetical protein